MSRITGVQVVFQTPFHEDGALDTTVLRQSLEWLFDQGTDGIVFAMVSEFLRLSSEERDEVATVAGDVARGRGDCIISVGAESTVSAIRHTRAATDAGATALMATPPALFPVDDEDLLRYFMAIAEATSLPIVVQDASGYMGRPLSIELQARMHRELGERAYFKPESPPIGPRVTQLLDRTDGQARIFEGTGGLHLVESYHRGAIGTMPAGDLVWAMVALWQALTDGDDARAYRIAGPLAQIVALQPVLDAFIAVEKHNLVRQGIFPRATVREPAARIIDDGTARQLDHLVDLLRAAVDG